MVQVKISDSLMCGFEGTSVSARWLSWLERRPVTAEVMGSNPIRVVKTFIRRNYITGS